MYEITKNVMQDANLSAATKIVMAVISQGVKSNTQSNISYSALAGITTLTEITVAKAVKALQMAGYINVTKNDRGWNCYEVVGKNEEKEKH
jgi:DNA-binding MarR family transcriptional regulator